MRTFHTYEHSVGDDDSFGLPTCFLVRKNLITTCNTVLAKSTINILSV